MKNPQKPESSQHGKTAGHDKSRPHRVEGRTPTENKPESGGQKRQDEPNRVHAPDREGK